jgi:hypothetical protein
MNLMENLMALNDKKSNTGMTPQDAIESLRNDFGEEGLRTLLSGADDIIDISTKFGTTYAGVVEKIQQDEKDGKIRIIGDSVVSIEPKEKEKE